MVTRSALKAFKIYLVEDDEDGPEQRRTLPAPADFQAHDRGGGWWYLTWQPVAGATGYEQQHEFASGPIAGTKTTLFAIPPGDNRQAKVRAVAGSTASPWITCTLTSDGTLTVAGDGITPPHPPAVPTVDRVTAGHQSITAGWTSTDAARWRARLIGANGEPVHEVTVRRRRVEFNDLLASTRYGFQVRAVAENGRVSAYSPVHWTTTLEGEKPLPNGPAKPTGLRVHCVTETSAKAEWDQPVDPVDGWYVSLPGHDDAGDSTISTLVSLTELQPDTRYTVRVVAYRGDMTSPAAEIAFQTYAQSEDPSPEDPAGQLPDVTGLYTQATGDGGVEAFWDAGGGADFWIVSAEHNRWRQVKVPQARWSGLAPGQEYSIEVYGVAESDSKKGTKLSPVARSRAVTTKEADYGAHRHPRGIDAATRLQRGTRVTSAGAGEEPEVLVPAT